MDVRYKTVGGELCQNCGKRFKIVWHIFCDEIWKKITGKEEGGILCPECFDSLAAANN